ESHGPTNRFIGRYAFMIQPIGRSLDVNWIHNDAKAVKDPAGGQLNYFRNQNVGGYENNLAAFLCDLNRNIWNRNVAPYNALPYTYMTNPSPAMTCSGTAFDDAWQILKYRYNGPKQNLDPLDVLCWPRTAAEVG